MRHLVSYGNPSDDVVWAYLLVPTGQSRHNGRAVVCLPSSYLTRNCGVDVLVGLAEPDHTEDPEAYGHDLAKQGYVVLCPDYPCCGRRTSAGLASHNTTNFDRRFPAWSRLGMSVWDVSRAVDFLISQPDLGIQRVGCMGFSQGGMMSLWGVANDPRIAVVATVCGWSPFTGCDLEPLTASYYYPRLRHLLASDSVQIDLPTQLAKRIAPKPFLSIWGRDDRHFPNHHQIEQVSQTLSKTYQQFNAADQYQPVFSEHGHRYTPAIRDAVFRWFDNWL